MVVRENKKVSALPTLDSATGKLTFAKSEFCRPRLNRLNTAVENVRYLGIRIISVICDKPFVFFAGPSSHIHGYHLFYLLSANNTGNYVQRNQCEGKKNIAFLNFLHYLFSFQLNEPVTVKFSTFRKYCFSPRQTSLRGQSISEQTLPI